MYPLLFHQVKKLTWAASCLLSWCFDTIIWTVGLIGQKVTNMKVGVSSWQGKGRTSFLQRSTEHSLKFPEGYKLWDCQDLIVMWTNLWLTLSIDNWYRMLKPTVQNIILRRAIFHCIRMIWAWGREKASKQHSFMVSALVLVSKSSLQLPALSSRSCGLSSGNLS